MAQVVSLSLAQFDLKKAPPMVQQRAGFSEAPNQSPFLSPCTFRANS
jgi:hypothetical protein